MAGVSLLDLLCATLAGAEDFVEGGSGGGRSSASCFAAWVEGLREDEPEIVALDGKSSRRLRRGEDHPLHVVSAWAIRQRLVLGQQAVGRKSNEIVAIPLLLERTTSH
jgi:hypothetical protein